MFNMSADPLEKYEQIVFSCVRETVSNIFVDSNSSCIHLFLLLISLFIYLLSKRNFSAKQSEFA